ncbi:MAG: GHKL domain-containing protein [Oscillospiraceae bacterium]|nr:GHKL domain-containing protein [Oscillospiraceae bacterium]
METVLHPLIGYINQTVTTLIWLAAVGMILPRRRHGFAAFAIVAGTLIAYYLIPLLPILSFQRLAIGVVIFAAAVQLLFEGGRHFKLLLALLVMLVMFLSELLFTLLLPTAQEIDSIGIGAQIVITICCTVFEALLLMILVFVVQQLCTRRGMDVVIAVSPLFILFPITQLIADGMLVHNWLLFSQDALLPLVIFIAFSLVADVIQFRIFERMTQSAEIEKQNALLRAQIEAQQEYYVRLAEHFESVRRMRHDIDNMLFSIKALLADDQRKEAERFAEALFSAQPPLADAGNTIAASFLLHKKRELEAQGIRLECDTELPPALGIRDPDLISVLGNLLDNAAEACAAPAVIHMQAQLKGPYLFIQVSNPIGHDSVEKQTRTPELRRGLGQVILRDLADKYDGEFRTSTADGTYTATLLLKASATGNEPPGIAKK